MQWVSHSKRQKLKELWQRSRVEKLIRWTKVILRTIKRGKQQVQTRWKGGWEIEETLHAKWSKQNQQY